MKVFLLALLGKTVTASLPAALLIVFWSKRGRLEWRRDIVPLLPFFAAGVAFGLLTAWFERTALRAHGAEFDVSVARRILLGGRAIWFYLWPLLWPVNLMFIYPRWHIDPGAAAQGLFPAAVVVSLAVLWW